MLCIVASCHCMQFQGKLQNQNWENGKKKTSFGTDFGSFGSNLGPQIFFSWILPALDITHYCKLSLYAISRKTNEANLRKWPKLLFQVRFWPKFVPPSQTNKLFGVLYLEDVMHCYKLSSYATSRETNESNLRKWQNPSFATNFGTFGPNLGPNLFLWMVPLQDVRSCCKLSLYAIS